MGETKRTSARRALDELGGEGTSAEIARLTRHLSAKGVSTILSSEKGVVYEAGRWRRAQ